MVVQKGAEIDLTYSAVLGDGTHVSHRGEDNPLRIVVGEGTVFPKLEEALTGVKLGESIEVRLQPEEAYGPYREELRQTIERSLLPDAIPAEVGTTLQIQNMAGQVLDAIVVQVLGDSLVVDANHPLAGREIVYRLEVVGIVAK